MEALNLKLKFKKLERPTVVAAKKEDVKFLTSFLTVSCVSKYFGMTVMCV